MASPSPSPKTAQHQPPSTPSVLHSLREFVTPTDLLLNVTGLVAAIVAGAAQPLMNIPFGNITSNFVQASPDSDALVQRTDHNVVYFLYLAAATFVAVYLCLGTWIYTGERITNRMRRAYFSKLLSQEVEFYSRRGAGSLTANMDSDFQNIQNGISEKVALNAMYLSCCIAGFAVAIIRSWRLGLSLLPMLPVLVAITLLFSHLAVKYTMGVIGAFAQSSALIDESLSAIKTIHSLGAGPDILEKHRANVMQAHQQAQLRAWSVAGCMGAINFVIYSGYALAFFYGAILLRRGDIEAGIIITVFLSIMMGSFALAQIPNSIQTFVSAWSSLKSIQEVLHRVPVITSPPSPQKASLQRLIRFDSVDFTYPSRIDGPALSNFTLDIAAGKTTAIVGASGSFKSTLCALLVRLYDPQHGSVSLDGTDVRALDLRDLRGRCVSLVSQEAVLIQGSIVENVLSGLPPAEAAQLAHTGITAVLQARAREACIASDAHTFIMGLPQGYFTKVGTGGLQLSGGQRARLAIARALIRAPELLILDEATANLDMISESKVHASLRRSSAGRTTIVVAHRLSAIRGADHIVLMQSGKLVAQGTHQDLLRSADGVYRRLLQAAADDDDDGGDPIVPARPEQGGPEHDSAPAGSEGEAEERSLEASDEAADKVSPAELRSTPSDQATPDQLNTHDVETGAFSTSPSKPKAVSISPWTLFMKIAPASLGWITLGLVGCLGAGLAYPAFAVAYGQAFSTFSTDRYDAHEQTLNALWFFLIAIFGSAATAAHIIGLTEASTKFSSACRVKMLASLFRKPIAFFDEECNSAGHLAKIVCSAPEATEKVTGSTMGSFISSGITLLGGAVVALSYNWRFALVNLSVVPLTLLTGLCRLKVIDAKEQRLRAAHDPSTALASEAVSAFRTIVSLAQEDQIFQRFSAMLDQTRHFARRMALLDTAVFALAQTNMFFVIALGFWYGGRLISHGQLSQREFFVCFIAIVSGSFQCVNLLAQSPEVSQAKLAFSQICRVFEDDLSQPKPKDGTQPSQPSTMSLEKALEFDDVHFSFPSRNKAVLRGVTFGCPAGSHIALCGPSGSGKTTAISLIERFYRPEKGVISLDEVDIDAIDLDVYRSSVSLVTQEPVLFSGTIEDNMLLGLKIQNRDQGADKLDAAIRQALRDANLLTTVESLADGIKTDLGSKGVNLSGGQRQRLALARALLKQPKLLLLDEATSSLDYENQAAVQAALDAASQSQDRTTVSVVHRLETLRNVPHIAVMQDGCIVEEGTFDSLTKKQGGLFARMLSSADRNARS